MPPSCSWEAKTNKEMSTKCLEYFYHHRCLLDDDFLEQESLTLLFRMLWLDSNRNKELIRVGFMSCWQTAPMTDEELTLKHIFDRFGLMFTCDSPRRGVLI